VARMRGVEESLLVRVASTASIIGMQSAVFAVTTRMGSEPLSYIYFFVALPTIGLFISRVRSYLEHGRLEASQAGVLVARTHRSNAIERNLLSSLFFNYHNEHHRWPQVPSRNLARLHETVCAGRIPEHDYSPSYFASVRKLIRSSWTR
jgi:fatty acid desaturase